MMISVLPPVIVGQFYKRLQQIAGVEITFGKGIRFQFIQNPRHKILRTDILPDHDTQILDRELADRLFPQPVTGGNKMGVEIRLAPHVAFEFLYRL